MAVKLANRKFVMRVVKLSEKNIYNISNLIFLVSLIVFGNIEPSENTNVFSYFKSFEGHLLTGAPPFSKQEPATQEPSFLDSKLILETVNSLKASEIDLTQNDPLKLGKMINAYLDL